MKGEPISLLSGKKNKIIAGIVIILLIIAIILVFFATTSKPIGKNIFAKNTFINGIEVSNLTAKEAEEHLNSSFVDKEFIAKNSRDTQVVLGSSFDYKEELAEELGAMINSQSPLQNLKNSFVKQYRTAEIRLSYDEAKLKQVAESFSTKFCETATPSQNACVERQGDEFVIVDEVYGNEVDTELLYNRMVESISLKETLIDIEQVDVSAKPEILKKDLIENKTVDKLNQMINLNIDYDFEYTTEAITKDQLASWVSFDSEAGVAGLNEEKIKEYIVTLAKKYDTYYTNRNFTTTAGNNITVGGGIYGWQMDVDKTTKVLMERITNLKGGKIQPEYKIYGMTRGENNNDIGNTYVEVDLTKQTMWYYVNGEILVETAVVTGLPGTWRETPTGVFSVWSKERKRWIVGEDYKLWVEYWIPINWGGVGIHDAPWQSTFGGDHYLTHGSHGCINTPPDKIAIIYDNLKLHTPVIIYKS